MKGRTAGVMLGAGVGVTAGGRADCSDANRGLPSFKVNFMGGITTGVEGGGACELAVASKAAEACDAVGEATRPWIVPVGEVW